MKITDTWFYNTRLKNKTGLLNTLNSKLETKIDNTSTIMAGNPGIGKTTQALLVCRDYINNNIDQWHNSLEPDFITFYDLVKNVKDSMFSTNPNIKYNARVSLLDLETTKFLIIDDFKCEKLSNYEDKMINDVLHNLLSNRYDNQDTTTTTMITTNNTEKQIKDTSYSFMTPATTSRLFGLCNYTYTTGKDKRQNKKIINI